MREFGGSLACRKYESAVAADSSAGAVQDAALTCDSFARISRSNLLLEVRFPAMCDRGHTRISRIPRMKKKILNREPREIR
jgi:hypothetical protein